MRTPNNIAVFMLAAILGCTINKNPSFGWAWVTTPAVTSRSDVQKTGSQIQFYTSTSMMDDSDMMLSTGPLIVGAAVLIGVAAQGWINNLASGERGLGAYLQDGRGYSGSGFSKRSTDKDAVSGGDPLPWLKLPNLDFVEVAGQKSDSTQTVERQLELIRLKMNQCLEEGQIEQATELRQELEAIMAENGFDFTAE